MIYIVQKNKKDSVDPQVNGGKCTKPLKWPKRDLRGEKESKRLINAMTYHISTFHSCANLTLPLEKKAPLSNRLMHETQQTTNTLCFPSSRLLAGSDDAGDDCIVSRHVACSLCHNQTPGTISHFPDIQKNDVAKSNRRKTVVTLWCASVAP